LIAVLFSQAAQKTMLSTTVIFLLAGFILGRGAFHLLQISSEDTAVIKFTEIVLFSVLFTDGMKIDVRDLHSEWRPPGRALLLGMPLTLILMAFLAHVILQLTWLESFLVGAVLSPTDPVFASAIVSRQEVPMLLRKMLNIESGLNDGLALPFVLVILAFLGGKELQLFQWIVELIVGVILGVAIAWLAITLTKWKLFAVSDLYRPLLGLSIGMVVFALAGLVHSNQFLAAFSASITIATLDPDLRKVFLDFVEPLAELLKLGAVLIFGALLSFDIFFQVGLPVYVYAALVLLLARPAALGLVLIGSSLNWRERLAAAWFGPRGFASVVYGLYVFQSGIPHGDELFKSISIVIIVSMVAHSSTDTLIAKWFKQAKSDNKQLTNQDPE
jgi:sodium/hydrogen antiporter